MARARAREQDKMVADLIASCEEGDVDALPLLHDRLEELGDERADWVAILMDTLVGRDPLEQ